MYNWQLPDWPDFYYDHARIDVLGEAYRDKASVLAEKFYRLSFDEARGYLEDRAIREADATSRIESEFINRQELENALTGILGLGIRSGHARDHRAKGVLQMVAGATMTFRNPLSGTMLKYWHDCLFSGYHSLTVVGDYRQGPEAMRVVSFRNGKLTVHFEAPPADRVAVEMAGLIDYCQRPVARNESPFVRAGLAHLWFESIHPFEDGNGRIGRALIEKLLSQEWGAAIPFSVSEALYARRSDYYAAFQATQRSMEVTAWLEFFGEILLEAVAIADRRISAIHRRNDLLERHAANLSAEMVAVLEELYQQAVEGASPRLTAREYARRFRVSRATATRALQRLVEIGCLIQRGRGRGVHYVLPFEENRSD